MKHGRTAGVAALGVALLIGSGSVVAACDACVFPPPAALKGGPPGGVDHALFNEPNPLLLIFGDAAEGVEGYYIGPIEGPYGQGVVGYNIVNDEESAQFGPPAWTGRPF